MSLVTQLDTQNNTPLPPKNVCSRVQRLFCLNGVFLSSTEDVFELQVKTASSVQKISGHPELNQGHLISARDFLQSDALPTEL